MARGLRSGVAAWSSVALALGSALACQSILGIQDPQPLASGGKSGSGGNTVGGNVASQGGDDSAGGDSSSGSPEGIIGTVGEPCWPEGEFGCAGYNQKSRIVCIGGVWAENGLCAQDQNCDTTPGGQAGECAEIVPECAGKPLGYKYCDAQRVVACGPDLVNSYVVDTCGVCANGSCECPTGSYSTGKTGDQRCAPCEGGVWGSTPTLLGCAWTVCEPGTYAAKVGTPDSDQQCAPCPLGTSTEQSNVSSCAPVQVALGTSHSCALPVSGWLHCWGSGADGQLGYGNYDTIGDNEDPVWAGLLDVGEIKQIAAGGTTTCVLLATGAIRCWGGNQVGQLGYGNTDNVGGTDKPLAAVGNLLLGSNALQVVAGDLHTCALLEDRTVRCWGSGYAGRLGYGNPEMIGDGETLENLGEVPVGALVNSLAAGGAHTCAVLETGTVRCWGSGARGQLGNGNKTDIGDSLPASESSAIPFPDPVIQVSAGGSHTCALTSLGDVYCWGKGENGQLGYGNGDDLGDDEFPLTGPVDLGGKALQISAGAEHTCAVRDDYTVRCWGSNASGQLGYWTGVASIGRMEVPTSYAALDVGGEVLQVAAGRAHTCVIRKDLKMLCWGENADGQLGYGKPVSLDSGEAPIDLGTVTYY